MILDTDTISYYLRGSQSVRKEFLKNRLSLASTTINYAELIFGLKKRDNKKYLSAVELIFNNITVFEFDKTSAKIFGRLKSSMQKTGNIVADMDLMIASIAIANDKILISNNLKHFNKIKNLKVISWEKIL